MGRGRGLSRYNGLRATLTQSTGSDQCIVTVAVKGPGDGWDEWTLFVPAIRLDTGPLTASLDAAEVLGQALEAVFAARDR